MLLDTDAAATARPPEYPRREPFFANRFLRLIDSIRLSSLIGENAVALLKIIAMQEDAKRYRASVTFHNESLMEVLNFAKWDRLDKARKVAQEAGWLHYENACNRKAGIYWVTIPEEFAAVEDRSIDDSDLMPSRYDEGYRDGHAAGYEAGYQAAIDEFAADQPYPKNGDEQILPTENGYRQGDNEGYRQGYKQGEPSSLVLIHNLNPIGQTEADSSSEPTEAFRLQRPTTKSPKRQATTLEDVLTLWNETFETSSVPTDKRRAALRSRLREPYFVENWRAAIDKARSSPWCCGHNKTGWVANIDWFLRPDTVVRLIEGNHDGHIAETSEAARERSNAEAIASAVRAASLGHRSGDYLADANEEHATTYLH